MTGFLNTGIKNQCYGCEACVAICPVSAISMTEDEEKFRYPIVDNEKCINCGLCHKACPYENPFEPSEENKTAFGGQHIDKKVLSESTSGGAFTAIIDAWCDENYVIFGAKAEGLRVFHSYVKDKKDASCLKKSKYIQSEIGSSYKDAKQFLKEGKKVLFSGTPCQISGLKTYLRNKEYDNLLTVEVVCEGVPTPYYMEKYEKYISDKYGCNIDSLDYRYKKFNATRNKGKWDFQVMETTLNDGKKIIKDRWFNPFWSIWLKHLMSRPSCYECGFAKNDRNADITLGDLWGVHLYCPELYFKNSGASLIVCNTQKGKKCLENAKKYLNGHDLKFEDALKYQSPMRKHIDGNDKREEFMVDVKVLDYLSICKKWATKPSINLLWQKYVWGNRQKVWFWNLKNRRNK